MFFISCPFSDFHGALNILKKESTDNGATRMSVIQMVNNAHNPSLQLPNVDDVDINSSSGPNTAAGHHLRVIRTLSQMSQHSDDQPSHTKVSPVSLSRTLSGFKSSANNFKKIKLSKTQSRSESDMKQRRHKTVPHFGNRKIASCLIKLSQARLLISEDIPEHREYHSAALHDAELAIQIIPSEINFSLVCVVCYIRLNRYEHAATLLDTLLESHPSHKKALYHRAFCYRAINNSFKAIECLTKVSSFVHFLLIHSADHLRDD